MPPIVPAMDGKRMEPGRVGWRSFPAAALRGRTRFLPRGPNVLPRKRCSGLVDKPAIQLRRFEERRALWQHGFLD
jgi:hypothetical protein